VRARFYSLMKGAPFWYIPSYTKEDPSLLFWVHNMILAGNLKLNLVEFGINEAPRNKRKAVEKTLPSSWWKMSTLTCWKKPCCERID
jgi:hypothetical protein